ncbi:MAG: beta-glucosidase [Bacilli bacterium]
MNLKQRVAMLTGKDVWHTYSNKKLKIKSLAMADGPHGLRKQIDNQDNLGLNSSYPATLFPSEATVACSFNKKMVELMGETIAKEAKAADVHIVLGPGVNIKRNPLCGRNFEYFSEDPHLSGTMGASWIKGLQSQNIGASLKHFAVNNQETYRFNINAVVDERALREIYLKPFEIAIKENPATVMAAYNKINGVYATENKKLLNDILRKEWNYKGVTVSDWGAVSNRVQSLLQGLDLEMPSSGVYNSKKLIDALHDEYLIDNDIDAAVGRILKMVEKYQNNIQEPFDKDEHFKIAQQIATDSIVLLKNDGILPLKPTDKVAIVGAFAQFPRIQGGGSSNVNPIKVNNVIDEINNYTHNCKYFRGYTFENDGFDQNLIDEVVHEANLFDKIVLMIGLPEEYETEGIDRRHLSLPQGHLKLVEAVLKVNPHVIITLSMGAPVDIPFEKDVSAIVALHLLGGASGKPVLDILYGQTSPSGRLATTFPLDIKDDPSTANFADGNHSCWYQESLYVGYRYYETFKKPVRYPFGFGLSYTTFAYSDLTVSIPEIRVSGPIEVKVKVKNNGKKAGSEVVLLFVQNNSSPIYKPLRELRAFDKVYLEPKAQKEVVFVLNYQDFAYYDADMKDFHVDKGQYKVQICKNASEVILEETIIKVDNETGFSAPYPSAYNDRNYHIEKEDFQKLLGRLLPPKSIVKHRPFTMDATLNDVKHTTFGFILYQIILRKAGKMSKNVTSDWMKQAMKETLTKTPLRTIAVMSGGAISLTQMEGLVDIINFRIIRGLGKL